MEYNTQREQMKISDYGRNVVKMIEYCKTIDDREERNQMAKTIVNVMAQVNPGIKDHADYRRTLWDHMMFIAGYDLDVDTPYPIHHEEPSQMHPNTVKLPEGEIRYRHYGRTLEDMVHAVAEMPASEERDLLTQQIAATMKRQYLVWNRDTVDDALIVEQLSALSGGRLTLPEGFKFRDSQEYLGEIATAQAKNDNKKKKKKRKKSASA